MMLRTVESEELPVDVDLIKISLTGALSIAQKRMK